jgi:hypothetical protein
MKIPGVSIFQFEVAVNKYPKLAISYLKVIQCPHDSQEARA